MNTNKALNSSAEKLPYLPILPVSKHRRVFTRHFVNTALWLSADEFMLLSYLCYQTNADNTFKYNTKLLEQFIAAIKAAREEYSRYQDKCTTLLSTIFYCRRQLVNLIEKGLILPTSRKGFLMLSPMLSYNSDIVNNKKYKEVQEKYNEISAINIIEFTDYFVNLVATFLESKKPNYKYGRRKL